MELFLITVVTIFAKSSTTQKMKFFIKDFFSKYDQIGSFLRIWSDLLKKSLMENFIFCAVLNLRYLTGFWMRLWDAYTRGAMC